MKIGILKEVADARVVTVPATVKKMIATGYEVLLEQGAGERASFSDQQYEAEGATVHSRTEVLAQADMMLSIFPLAAEERDTLKPATILVAMFNPRGNPAIKEELAATTYRGFSMDSIPRTTIAQSMDVLSSMASLAGYKAVLQAADQLPSYFPMLMTAAGTIPPAKVLVLGAGVAGLQAIATARRLGATVEAFDVRSAVKEEVQSLGAKFVEVEGAQEDAGAGGYAVEQTEDYQRRQKALVKDHSTKADVIITTANIPGRKAPILIEASTVEAMKPGSVIVDLAAATGGNCELTENDKTVVKHGVTIVGNSNLPGGMPRDASILLSNNYFNFIKYVFGEDGAVDYGNEIVQGTYLGAPVPQETTSDA